MRAVIYVSTGGDGGMGLSLCHRRLCLGEAEPEIQYGILGAGPLDQGQRGAVRRVPCAVFPWRVCVDDVVFPYSPNISFTTLSAPFTSPVKISILKIKNYIGVCMEGAVIVLACLIYSAFLSSSTPAADASLPAVTMGGRSGPAAWGGPWSPEGTAPRWPWSSGPWGYREIQHHLRRPAMEIRHMALCGPALPHHAH